MESKKEKFSHWQKMCISFALFLIAITLFWFPYTKTVESENVVSKIKTIRTYYTLRVYGAQVIGSALLILAVWLWRKELGISVLGPLGEKEDIADELEPKDPEESQEKDIVEASETVEPVSTNVTQKNFYDNERKSQLLQLVRKHHYLSAIKASSDLGVSTKSAQAMLFNLFTEGKIDRSAYKGKEVFLDKDFWENKAIDWVIMKLSQREKIDSVYKQVRYKTASFDAIAETEDKVFFIEITTRPERAIERIQQDSVEFEKRYNKQAIYIIATIAIEGKFHPEPPKIQIHGFEFWQIPSEVVVFPKTK